MFANDEDDVEFEIYSRRGDEDVVHCRGRAVLYRDSTALDLRQLPRDNQARPYQEVHYPRRHGGADPQLGHWVSKNLAGVALPVNADIPSSGIDVDFIDEVDEHASPIGAKGIGELGATGVDAAVADAVFHASGKRIRELPITPDKLV